MKIRIIKIHGCKTCKEVLIYLSRDEQGDEYVQLIAWHTAKDGDLIQAAQVDYCKANDDHLMNERIIADFSEASANAFANSMEF